MAIAGRFEATQTINNGRLPTRVACRVLDVSESGFYARVDPAAFGPVRSVMCG